MNHPDPNAFVEQLMSFIERLDRHQPLGGSAELSVFDLATIQKRFSAASGGAS